MPNASNARPVPDDEARTPWSIRVGRCFGIPIRIHFTFLLLLVWLVRGADGVLELPVGTIDATGTAVGDRLEILEGP